MPVNVLMPSYGLSNSKLEEATAQTSHVMNGKTFYAGDRSLKTGTLTLTGNATVNDVLMGKTFYSDSFTKITGNNNFAYRKLIFISGLSHYDLSLNRMFIIESENGVNTKYEIGPGGALDEDLWYARCTTITGSSCNGYFRPKVDMSRIFWFDALDIYYPNKDTFKSGTEYMLWGLHHALTAVSIVLFV